MNSTHKNIFFSFIFAFSLILFLFFGIHLHETIENDISKIQVSQIVFLFLALVFQVLGIIFLAIRHTSRLFLFLPLVLSFFVGMVIFNNTMGVFFTLGLPLAYMFFRIQKNIKTRIRINMSEDVRRPITTFFVMAIFFGSFFLAPLYAPQLQKEFNKIVAQYIPQASSAGENIKAEISPPSPTNQSMSDIIDSIIAEKLKRCQGDSGCEALMRREAKKQIEEQMKGTPLESIFKKVNLESNAPLSEEITNQLTGQALQQMSFGNEKIAQTLSHYFWGIIAFLLFSPFAIVFSFLTMIFVRFFYTLFRIMGILHITTKSTLQEIIV